MIEVTTKDGNQKLIINELNFTFAQIPKPENTTKDPGCLVIDSDGVNFAAIETYEEIKIKLGIK